MATHVLAEVLEYSGAHDSELLVLIILADQASRDTREAEVSMELIMKHTKKSERTVRYALRRLEALGEVSVVVGRGRGRCSVYRIANFVARNGANFAPFNDRDSADIRSAPANGPDSSAFRDPQRVQSLHPLENTKGANSAPFNSPEKGQVATEKGAIQRQEKGQSATDTYSVNYSVIPQQQTALSGSAARHPTERELAKVILHELNRRTFKPNGTGFEPVEPNLKPLSARIREYGADKVARVTVRKIMQWWGTNMEGFLRPKTLYNATNFANYVGEGRLKRSDGRKVVEAFTDEQIKIVRSPFEIPGEQGRITP